MRRTTWRGAAQRNFTYFPTLHFLTKPFALHPLCLPYPQIYKRTPQTESPYHIYFVTDFLSGGDLFYHLTHSRDTRGTDGLGEEVSAWHFAKI